MAELEPPSLDDMVEALVEWFGPDAVLVTTVRAVAAAGLAIAVERVDQPGEWPSEASENH